MFGSAERSAWLLAKERLIMYVTALVLELCTKAPTRTGEAQTTTISCQGSPPTSGLRHLQPLQPSHQPRSLPLLDELNFFY